MKVMKLKCTVQVKLLLDRRTSSVRANRRLKHVLFQVESTKYILVFDGLTTQYNEKLFQLYHVKFRFIINET